MTETDNNFAETIKDLAVAGISPRRFETGQPFMVIPEGSEVKDLEKMLLNPVRKTGLVVASDTDSFIAYTKKHGSLDDCTIYAAIDCDKSQFQLVGVINDHGADNPQWRDFRCELTPKLAVEWRRWTDMNRKNFNQADFATFIEDNLGDIASVEGFPSGAEMLAMALGFEANSTKQVRSKINLQNGNVQFEFAEEDTTKTKTTMQVFQRFTLGIPVFDGSKDAYPLEARLKYRENGGKLTFWFELIRPDRVFKTAVQTELDAVKAALGFPIIQGFISK
jgi:uncharacterized protein YfdQ (DUF2303 family)